MAGHNPPVNSSTVPTAVPIKTDTVSGVDYQVAKLAFGADGAATHTQDTDGSRWPVGGSQLGATNETAPASDTAAAGLNGRLQRIAQNLSTLGTTSLATLMGAINETAPASDTANSGLNGRLQRIAQRLTSILTDFDALTGALLETAPASDTASSGLNGRLQRIAQRLTSLIALLPTALTTNGGAMKVGASEVVLTASVASGATLQATGSDLAGLRNWGFIVPSTFDGTQVRWQMSDTLGGTCL